MLQIERSAKRPSRAIGFLAALRAFPHAQGSSTPKTGRGSGAPAHPRTLAVFVSLCVSVVALLCISAPAFAAAPMVSEESVSEVADGGATLDAVIVPEGEATT
jgi:hypothetical protein